MRFTGCQRRAESPQKWRRKIPQPGGMAISRLFGASVFRWSAPAFQRRRNGVRGGLRFVADCLGDEIGGFAGGVDRALGLWGGGAGQGADEARGSERENAHDI